ncbi:MAG: helix-turn-helix domain-containing protein [Bacteroidota bacterium]|nr:helix-turn-helix domain-containing protein [Bacteroidota bacterium]
MDTAKRNKNADTFETCRQRMLAVKDALGVLNGRWKIPIMTSLLFGDKRFKEISKEIDGVTDKMLSKELKDLEINQLVKKEARDTFPPTVKYSLTEHGRSLETVVAELYYWGSKHRKKIIGK